MSDFVLSPADLARINLAVDLNAPGGVGVYANAYREVVAINGERAAQGLPTLDPATLYWFERATQINENNPLSAANSFIRGVTVNGLEWNGLDSSNIQGISNRIGQQVLDDINGSGTVPAVGQLLVNDISSALDFGDMTVGGWGGSFYYWNLVYTDPGTGHACPV